MDKTKNVSKINKNSQKSNSQLVLMLNKLVLITHGLLQFGQKKVENAHKNNKNAQKSYLHKFLKMLRCIKWQNYVHENYKNVTNGRMIHEFKYLAWQNQFVKRIQEEHPQECIASAFSGYGGRKRISFGCRCSNCKCSR